MSVCPRAQTSKPRPVPVILVDHLIVAAAVAHLEHEKQAILIHVARPRARIKTAQSVLQLAACRSEACGRPRGKRGTVEKDNF